MKSWKAGFVLFVVGWVLGCSNAESSTEESRIGRVKQALSNSVPVMGFENSPLWSSPAQLSSSTIRTQGARSLGVRASGYTEVVSTEMSAPARVTNTLAVDVRLPTAQPNPFWYGAVQLFVSIPRRGVYNAYLGQQELTSRPLDQFFRLDFTVPNPIATTLRVEGYEDLTFKLVLNVPSNATGTYLVDNLRFVPNSFVECGDFVEDDVLGSWSWGASDAPPATTTLSVLASADALRGQRALRAETTSGFDFWVRYQPLGPIDVSSSNELRVAVRGRNTTPIGWQGNFPLIVVEDSAGARIQYQPTRQLLSIEGIQWKAVTVPLAGSSQFIRSGGPVDWRSIRAVEIHADTWDFGFTLDVDALSFARTGSDCSCTPGCGTHGSCDQGAFACTCDLGWAGRACDACATGFVAQGGSCALANDGVASVWPNQFSKATSDPWLSVHHDEVRTVRPNVLVLDFVNTSTPAQDAALVNQLFAGYREASRMQGYKNPTQPSQLDYQLAKFVDLRDGVSGRPPAPPGYAYQNSTLWPHTGNRPNDGVGVDASFDYTAFFSESFAELYGYPDPAQPGTFLTLCELVDRGIVHDVWVVGSQDVPDAVPAEVLESKQMYTAKGNKIVGAFERCAGNGCFLAEVPVCGRSLRIGFVNYNRGPGCYFESLAHGMESALGNHEIFPPMTRWFVPYAGFNLDQKYNLPFSSLYAVDCSTPDLCMTYPTPTSIRIDFFGTTLNVDPWDAVCGNAHLAPNTAHQYDVFPTATVATSCPGFGRHAGPAGTDLKETITSELWRPYETLAGDCMGPFLVYWHQNMPAFGSGQTLLDGQPMKAVWPFLYY